MRTLFVVPTTDRADDLLAQLAATGGAVLGRHALTLRALEEQVAREALRGRRLAVPALRALALVHVLETADAGPWAPVAHTRGFRRALDAFLSETAAGGASFAEVERAARALGGPAGERAGALARLGDAFARLLDERGVADPRAALADACRRLEEGGPEPQPLHGIDVVVVQDIVDWPPGRVALVRALAAVLRRRGGRLIVELPRCADSPELLEASDPALRALETGGGDAELRVRPMTLPDPAKLCAFTAADPRGEAREIARRAAALLQSGDATEDVLVAARNMSELAPLLLDALAAHEVPARDRRGNAVGDSFVARTCLEIARLAERGACERERVAAVAGSPLVDLRGLVADAAPPRWIARHLRAAAVRDRGPRPGPDAFGSRLERLARACDRRGDERAGERVRATARTLAALFRRLDDWPASATAAAHARHLLSLLDDLRIPHRLRRAPAPGPEARPGRRDTEQTRALAFEQEAWSRLSRLPGQIADAARALRLQTKPLPRAQFTALLEELCAAETVRPGSARGGAVELLELADLAGRRVEHVFVAGVYDGRLPGPPDIDPLLPDEDRWALNRALGRPVFRTAPAGSAASPLPARQMQQPLLFALALEAGRTSVTLSAPRADEAGHPLAASPLPALARAPAPERVAFEPVAARDRSRSSSSIDARAAVALERTAFFAGGAGGPHTGDVAPAAPLFAPLVPGGERPASAHWLERAAQCGFRSWAEWLLGAEEEEERGDETDILEAGRLAHAAVEAAVKAVVERGMWSAAQAESAVALGLEAAARAIDAEEPHTVTGHPELWSLTRAKMLARLGRLLSLELAQAVPGAPVPAELELAFGTKDAPLPALQLGRWRLCGRIDRLDSGPQGHVVVDYKSGSSASTSARLREDALFVRELQLPLYCAAVKHLLPGAAGRPVDAVYASLRDGERSKSLSVAMGDRAGELEQRLQQQIDMILERALAGDASPRPTSCGWCALRPACRIPRGEQP